MNRFLAFLFAGLLLISPALAGGAGDPVTVVNPISSPVNVSLSNPSSLVSKVAGSSAGSLVICSAPCTLNWLYVTTGATPGYLMVFNATSAPGDGSTTAGTASGNLQDCIPVAASSTAGLQNGPEIFSVGATAVFSSTACATKTVSTTAFFNGAGQ